MAWMHRRFIFAEHNHTSPINRINSLTNQANLTGTRTGWNLLVLRQLQSEVNALVWRYDNQGTVPNADTNYQDTAVRAIQGGYSIDGQDIPHLRREDQQTIIHFFGPDPLAECLVTFQPNNLS
jgi:hypothetical protein